jgi:glycosyltransferase involved in cell wall biosynthesis
VGNLNNPLVSIITINLNSGWELEQTIQSVINQTYDNIEYLVIDGGSTDTSLNIIHMYEGRMNYWVSEKDDGPHDALNKGIKRSKGDIIGLINSSDWYEPSAVENIVECFNSNPNAEVIHGNLKVWKIDGQLDCIVAPKLCKLSIYISNPFNTATLFVKRKVYDRFGIFNKKFKISGDYEMWLRLYKNGVKFYYLNQVISNMRHGGRSNNENNLNLGNRECMEARRINNCNNSMSILAFIWCWLKARIMLRLQKMNLTVLILLLRKLSRHHLN